MTARLVAQPPRKPVAGIRPTTGGPTGNAGLFTLPPNFDQRQYAAQWAEVGVEAEYLQQPQPLQGIGLTADGWQIWKDPATKANREVTTRGKEGKKYVLMFRSRELQTEINALFGDKSKAEIYKAQMGQTIPLPEGAQGVSGMLTEQQLQQVDGTLEGGIKAPVATATSTTGPVQAIQSTKQSPK